MGILSGIVSGGQTRALGSLPPSEAHSFLVGQWQADIDSATGGGPAWWGWIWTKWEPILKAAKVAKKKYESITRRLVKLARTGTYEGDPEGEMGRVVRAVEALDHAPCDPLLQCCHLVARHFNHLLFLRRSSSSSTPRPKS